MLFLSNSRKAQRRKLAAERERQRRRAGGRPSPRRGGGGAPPAGGGAGPRRRTSRHAAPPARRWPWWRSRPSQWSSPSSRSSREIERPGPRVLATKRAEEAREQTQIALEAGREAKERETRPSGRPRLPPRPSRNPSGKPGSLKRATERARAVAKIATSRQLAALSVAERDRRFDRSLLLAVEAFQAENTLEARDSLYKALQHRPGLTIVLAYPRGLRYRAWPSARTARPSRPDTRRGADGGVVLWDVAARKRLGRRATCRERGRRYRAWPSARTARPSRPDTHAAAREGGVVLWDVAARKRLVDEPLSVKEGDVTSVAFSPDGKTIAAGYVSTHPAQRGRRGAVGHGRTQTPGRRATSRERGHRCERGLQPRRQDHRGRITTTSAAAAAWCCGTWPHANAWSTSRSPWRRARLERGLQPGWQDHRGRITAGVRRRRGTVGSGRTQAAGRRATPRERGRGTSVAFSPDGKTIAAGYCVGSRPAAWCCGTWPRANAWSTSHFRQRGRSYERGLQPGRQDHRGRIRGSPDWARRRAV